MKYGHLLLFFLFTSILSASDKEIKNEWKEHYKGYEGDACFILYDLNNDKYFIYNEKRANSEFLPASTFKIFNSLTALETGAVKDENEIIKWDGEKRFYEMWNRDLSMKDAIKYSAVWFYQELARRIGRDKMQEFINKAEYGNKDIRDSIDTFWLEGEIRITPMQQIDFLKRLYKNELPFSHRSMDIVKEILINEETNGFILRAKTGWALRNNNNIGWWVGYIETKENVYFFVNNMEIKKEGDEKGRIEAAKNILRDMKLYK